MSSTPKSPSRTGGGRKFHQTVVVDLFGPVKRSDSVRPPKGGESERHLTQEITSNRSRVFYDSLPQRPYCAKYPIARTIVRGKDQASSFPIIQPNSPSVWRWMVFDLDAPDSYFRAEERECPTPSFTAINKANGHAHIAYMLESPVTSFGASGWKPQTFYCDVERGLTKKLGADTGYSGLLCKNPLSEMWEVEWNTARPYQLAELNDCLTKADKQYILKTKKSDSPAGRNCEVFAQLSKIAYRNVLIYKKGDKTSSEFMEFLTGAATVINSQFRVPLNRLEVSSIAQSVARWVWQRFTVAKFSAIQSARVKKRWSKVETLESKKPWEQQGISRRTWFKRRKEQAVY
jgi:hypothetical protein